jgi:hypothetical protein
MLTKEEGEALYRWYTQDSVLDETRRLIEKNALEELEEYLHMTCLFPLSRHGELPDFMKNADGTPLFPTNLNPKKDLEKWQDAIEVGWQVVEERFRLSHAEVHRRLARAQKQDWDAFIESVEQRKKQRGQS